MEQEEILKLKVWETAMIIGTGKGHKTVLGQKINNELGKKLFNDFDMVILDIETNTINYLWD